MRARQALAAGAVVAAGTVLAACGVPVGGSPAVIARKNVPYGLLDKTAPSTPVPTGPSLSTIPIYLVGPAAANGTVRLVPEARDVPVPAGGTGSDAWLGAVLQSLIDGPTTAEAQAGLQGAIPSQTRVIAQGTGIAGTLATVNLSADFGQLAGQTQIQAVAQVVFTVMGAIPGLTGVSFEIAGQHASVPTPPNGALANVATRQLYASLAPA